MRIWPLLLLLVACGGEPKDEVWLDPSPAPEIVAGEGRLSELRGEVVLLSFGYTACSDVCPTTMRNLRAVLADLGAAASRVRVVYVTIDPARDDDAALRSFTGEVDRRIAGWRVDPAALPAVLAAYAVSAARRPPNLRRYVGRAIDPAKDYSLEHTGGVWMIDPRGRLRARYTHDAAPEAIEQGVRRLLDEKK